MTTTDTTVNNLVINTMTAAQYATITPSATELYMVTDEAITSSDVTTALGYTPVKSVNSTSPDANGNVSITIPDTTNMVTTNTDQDITGTKTFIGQKKILFKQSLASNKIGFTFFDNNNTELAGFEVRPNTVNSAPVLHLMAPNSASTLLGFRYWTSSSAGKEIIIPKPSSNGIYYVPLSFKNGNTTINPDSSGVADLSGLGFLDSSDIATSVSSSSTNAETVGAKLFYDTVGDIESLLQAV